MAAQRLFRYHPDADPQRMKNLRLEFPTALLETDASLDATDVRDEVRISETGEVLPTVDYARGILDEYRRTGVWPQDRPGRHT